jgi:replication initiation protein RepC
MPIEPNILSAQGSRRLTLTMLAAREQADQFEGLPRGMGKPFRFLAAFQQAAPYLGLPPHAFAWVSFLVQSTQAQDWEEGSRPIAWPSAARQGEFLALEPTAVKTLNRQLAEAGIVVMRDSPTGKRYGRRDPQGRVVEAYGFDLSPLAYRYDEFIRIAAEAKAERERMGQLKRRATCARRAIAQVGEILARRGPLPPAWPQLAAETAELVAAIRKVRTPDDLALIAQSLESRKTQAETWAKEAPDPVENDPTGAEERPHIISTNLSLYPSDTVIAAEESSRGKIVPEASEMGTQGQNTTGQKETPSDFEAPAKVHPGELLQLAPRLADHVPQAFPDWADIVNAAGEGLRHELGVSQALWGEACLGLGRPLAAVALAIVSTKPRQHFTRGAGGYFAAMIKRAKVGELHLDRSLWKLRRDRLDGIEREGRSVATWH